MKVLYHAHCNDGAAAALAVWLKYGDAQGPWPPDLDDPPRKIEYIPVQYGQDPPEVLAGEEVFIVDFSYKRDVLIEMAKVAFSVLVLDHHKTAEAELKDLIGDNIEVRFDMTKSGAVMAWEYFHESPVPKLFQVIQDRDLWRFEMGEYTKFCHKGLQLHPEWRTWMTLRPNDLAREGMAVNTFLELQSAKIIDDGPVRWDVTGDIVPVYNLPGFMLSDTLHAALEKYPDAPFAVGYFDKVDECKRVYSLRSRENGADVSEIAKRHGGGGHVYAAGFSVNILPAWL